MTQVQKVPQPLVGVRVLDLGRVIAAPLVGQILSDLGASVVKVERLGSGDETRSYSTNNSGHPPPLFVALNRNKRSLAINFAEPGGQRILLRLIEQTDILVHNFRQGVMERVGLGIEEAWSINRRLIYCTISGFGATGELREKAANDVTAQAYSGLMSYTGTADGPPVRCPVPIADHTAGLYAVIGILGALVERAATGVGRHVQTSLIEGVLSLESMQLVDYLASGNLPAKLASGNNLGQPNQAFPTADGAVLICALNDAMWRRCATAMGGDGLAKEARFLTTTQRLENRDTLVTVLEVITRALTSSECLRRLEAVGVVCGPINTLEGVVKDPHVRQLGIFQHVGTGNSGACVVGSPITIDSQRPVPRTAPPDLGVDTVQILRELGYDAEEIAELRRTNVVDVADDIG